MPVPKIAGLTAFLLLLHIVLPARADAAAERALLEARLAALETVLAGDVCADPDGARAVLARTPEGSGTAPASRTQQNPTAASTPAAALPRDQLAARLKRSVVMVLTPKDSGSGFFVTPDTLVTNAHVVAQAGADEVLLIGAAVKGVMKATVIARATGRTPQSRDYALLRIAAPIAGAALPLSPSVTELDPVIAAGFPGLLVENDIHFQKLLQGTPTGLPEMILSQGSVMAVQNRSSGLPTIAHSAAISGGNSGGPLIDSCGRAIGINSFIRVSVDQASNAGYALAIEDVIRFLKEQGLSPEIRDGGCR